MVRQGSLVAFLGLSLLLGGCVSHSVAVQNAIEHGDSAYLIQHLAPGTEEWVMEDAARGLGELHALQASPLLAGILSDPNAGPYRRAAAGLALGRMHDQRAVKPLIAALARANDPDERYWLIVGLYQFCQDGHDLLEIEAALQSAASASDAIIKRGAQKGLYDCAHAQPQSKEQPAHASL